MITRAWLAFSALWAIGWEIYLLQPPAERVNTAYVIWVLLPFLVGLVFKLVGRYVVYGSIARKR